MKPAISPGLTPPRVSERVLRNAALPGDVQGQCGHGVSFLNQACTHLLRQMVVKIDASDLDSFDRRLMRRRSRPRVGFANQLPVNPAGEIQLPEIQLPKGSFWWAPAARSPEASGKALWIIRRANPNCTFDVPTEIQSAVSASLCLARLKSQKADQCQEN